MLAYDNLALQYFYLGELSKSRYYNDRVMRGKYEAKYSIVRKMALNQIQRNINSSVVREPQGPYNAFGDSDGPSIAQGLKQLLGMEPLLAGVTQEKTQEYRYGDLSHMHDKIAQADVKATQLLTNKSGVIEAPEEEVAAEFDFILPKEQPKKVEPQVVYVSDEPVREKIVLRAGTPISDLSGRGLPSPTNVKGDSNVLMLPFYQEKVQDKMSGRRPSLRSRSNPAGQRKLHEKHDMNYYGYNDEERAYIDRIIKVQVPHP